MKRRFRSFRTWTIAFAGSVFLNISLFGLMPGLIQGVPDRQEKMDDIKQIQVIRVKKPPTPPSKKEQEDKPKPTKSLTKSLVNPVTPKPVNLKPRLAFELNAKLPAAPLDLVMPGLEHFSMDPPKICYTMGEIDSPLVALVKIPPIYPIRATRRSIEGFVTVEFLVTNQGCVEDLHIIEASPKGIFDQSVIQCVSHWKFKPGTVQGFPVATQARTTIRFELEQ